VVALPPASIQQTRVNLIFTFRRVRALELIVQDNTEERIIDADLAVVLDEAKPAEFIHEKIHTGARRANHLCQSFLGYLGRIF
jgi:hypothetical protein